MYHKTICGVILAQYKISIIEKVHKLRRMRIKILEFRILSSGHKVETPNFTGMDS